MRRIYALIDCNNFFVSCERLFRPDLDGQPMVVLSSNDGCAISRSQEAKNLGIPMGAPLFKFRDFFRRHGVVVHSANFELYGDVSERITNLLASITPNIEVYSVDESFLDLSQLDIDNYQAWGQLVRDSVLRSVGVPVSIGIAPSKTLTKLANHYAKQHTETGGVVYFAGAPSTKSHRSSKSKMVGDHLSEALEIDTCKLVLASTPVEAVWGVGWKLAPKLRAEGVHTAFDLRRLRPQRAQQLMGIHGRHMVYELNGTACLPLLHTAKPQQMVMRGRQFGEDTRQLHVIESAVASLGARAAAALRRERLLARQAVVILQTNRLKPGYQRLSESVRFYTPTADTGLITSQLVRRLSHSFNSSLAYHKADVLLYDLVPESGLQTDLFGGVNLATHHRSQHTMGALDHINQRYGKGTIGFAAEALSQSWRPRYNLASPRYTSDWAELPPVKPLY